jgi:Amino acid synthesis
MPEAQIRKKLTAVEEIFHEGGPIATVPLRRGAALTVIRNPYAGSYVQDILGFMDDLKPLGLEMARALVAALGGDPKVIQG